MPYKTKITPERKAVVWDYNRVFGTEDVYRCYQLSDRHIQALLATLTAMQWRTRWTDAPDDLTELYEFVGELSAALMMPFDCDNPPTSGTGGNGGGIGGGTFDDFLNLLMELDMKFQLPDGSLYEPAIPLVPCGCGDAETSGAITPPLQVEGASGGGDYGDFATLCDAVTALAGTSTSYLYDAWDDFTGVIATGLSSITLEVGDNLIPLVNTVEPSLTELQLAFQDPDFFVIAQNNVVKSFNDPWTNISRQDLRQFAYRFPPFFEGAPILAFMSLWAEFANLDLINSAVVNGRGQGNPDICEPTFGRVGRVQYTPPQPITEQTFEVYESSSDTTFLVRLFELNAPLVRAGDSSQQYLPYDYTGITLGAAGFLVNNIADVVGNNPSPRFRLNSDTSTWFSATSDLDGVATWGTAGRIGTVMQDNATFISIVDSIQTRTGINNDESFGVGVPAISDGTISVNCADIDSGSANIAYAWTAEVV